jgi:uncharacterized protein
LSILIDANILLYAKFSDFPQHDATRHWLDGCLNTPDPAGMPWVTLSAFARIATNRRVFELPLSSTEAANQISQWAGRSNVWHPDPGDRFADIFTGLLTETQVTGNLVPDAYLAALALEHGLTVISTDADFGRFPSVKWRNPISE